MSPRRAPMIGYSIMPSAGAAWLRPSAVTAISGSVEGGGLDSAPYPYDPDPALRGRLPRSGVRVGAPGLPGTARLTFPVGVVLDPPTAVWANAWIAQVLLIVLGGEIAVDAGFDLGEGYPHVDDLAGRARSYFARRDAFSGTPDRIDVTAEGATIVCVLAIQRVSYS